MPTLTKPRYRLETVNATRGSNGLLYRLGDETAGVRASVAPFAGAEICSLQVQHECGWLECLDRAEDFTPCDRWQGRAPWLWPAVGRNYDPVKLQRALREGTKLTDFEWIHGGKLRPMPIHGFVRDWAWKVVNTHIDASAVTVECSFTDDTRTRTYYPFGYGIHLQYRLADGVLSATFRIDASATNNGPMPFCLGNHITVRAPLTKDGRFEDVRVFAPVRQVSTPTSFGLVGEPTEISFREGVPLADGSLLNLIVGSFAREQAAVRVVDPCGLEIDVTQREVPERGQPAAPSDAFYFVFYGSRDQGFFCPEPWLGLPDALNTGRAVVSLDPGKSFTWEMGICVNSLER